VVDGLSTHRASRHFRNYWYYFSEGFDKFSGLVNQTWPGMEIEPPEFDWESRELTMFCKEERITRELYWLDLVFKSGVSC
jgi:hypothetical protein